MIEENGLLTVSILGLVVNIIGLSCFHDLHHHDGGSCDHGHAHGDHEGHSHDHHDHGHSHDHHNHGHSDSHDHHNHRHSDSHDHHNHEHSESHDHHNHGHSDDTENGHSHNHDHHSNSHAHHDHSPSHDHSSHLNGHSNGHSSHAHSSHAHNSHEHSSHDHSSHDHNSHDHDTEHGGHAHAHNDTGACAHNENVYGFFLHILADALGSVGVIISSLLIHYYGLYIADPICSVIISILIFLSVIPLIISSGSTLMLKNPSEDETEAKTKRIEALPDVYSVKVFNMWEVEKGKQVCTFKLNIEF